MKEVEIVVAVRSNGTAKIDWEATHARWDRAATVYDLDEHEWEDDSGEPEWFIGAVRVIENLLPRSES